MKFHHKLYNVFQTSLENFRKYIYILLPAISLIIYIVFRNIIFANIIEDTSDYSNNIINLSGILAGFLFTTFGTFMSLPDNKFLDALQSNGYFKSIYRVQVLGVVFLLIAMVIGLFNLSIKVMTIFFMFGISEALGSLYYFYKILTLSRKSNTKY